MLNISNNNKITENIEKYSTYKNLSERPHYKILNKIINFISIHQIYIFFSDYIHQIYIFFSDYIHQY